MTYASLGILFVKIELRVAQNDEAQVHKQITLQVDVLDLALPLLLSRASLIAMSASLDFPLSRLVLPGNVYCQLKDSHRGHSELSRNPTSLDSVENYCEQSYSMKTVFPTTSQTESIQQNDQEYASSSQIMKLRNHLGHAEAPTLLRVAKQAGFKNDRDSIEKRTASLPCEKKGNHPQNPILSRYQAQYHGQCVFGDIFYPLDDQKHPQSYIAVH